MAIFDDDSVYLVSECNDNDMCRHHTCVLRATRIFNNIFRYNYCPIPGKLCDIHSKEHVGVDPLILLDDPCLYMKSVAPAIWKLKKVPKNIAYRIGHILRQYVTPNRGFTIAGKEYFKSNPHQYGAFVAFYDRTGRVAKRSIRLLWKLRKELGGGKDLIRLISSMLWADRAAWADRTEWIK